MTRNPDSLTQWKLLLIGRSSVIARRLFVVGLSIVSLVVWAVTVIGLGGAGRVRMPREAMGNIVPAASRSRPVAMPVGDAETPPADLPDVPAGSATPGRDPFRPSDEYFAAPGAAIPGSRGGEDGVAVSAGVGESELSGLPEARPLKITATFLNGADSLAIIEGRVVEAMGSTFALAPSWKGTQLRLGATVPVVDVLEIRGGRLFRLATSPREMIVKHIGHRSVTLAIGEAEICLEMK